MTIEIHARLFTLRTILAAVVATLLAPGVASGQVRPPPVEIEARLPPSVTAQLRQRALVVQDSALLRSLRTQLSAADLSRLSRSWTLSDVVVPLTFGDTLAVAEPSVAGALPDVLADAAIYRVPEMEIVRRPPEGGTPARNAALELFLRAQPLRFDAATDAFVGRVDIWTRDPLEPSSTGPLPRALPVQLFPDVGEASPNPARLERIGVPATTIELRESRPLDAVDVLVVTENRPEGYPLRVPVRPALDLRVASDTVQAWGVEKLTLSLGVLGRGDVDSAEVNLLVGRSPDSRTVTVASGAPAQVTVRSGSPGDAVVQASSAELGEAMRVVHYAFPWRFCVAALFGGILGSFLAGSAPPANEEAAGGWGRRVAPFARGVVAGVLAVAAYLLLGMNLLPVELPSEAVYNEGLVLVVAALAAFAWGRGGLLIQGWGRRQFEA
jgi:hypothetical protein